MERITELFVVVDNRPGVLGDLLMHLNKEKVNLEAIGVFQDVAKLSVSDTDRAVKALVKGKYQYEKRDVLRVQLSNKPGAFAEIVSKLAKEGLNIDYCYGTVARGERSASVILDVSDVEAALRALA